MNLPGESVWWKPFDHGIGIQKGAIDPLRLGAEHAVESNGVGFVGRHILMRFRFHLRFYNERRKQFRTLPQLSLKSMVSFCEKSIASPGTGVGTGQTRQKVERPALRAVAPHRAARGQVNADVLTGPPAGRGRVWSQRNQTHQADFSPSWRCSAPPSATRVWAAETLNGAGFANVVAGDSKNQRCVTAASSRLGRRRRGLVGSKWKAGR
jgi:hypothetical protein